MVLKNFKYKMSILRETSLPLEPGNDVETLVDDVAERKVSWLLSSFWEIGCLNKDYNQLT